MNPFLRRNLLALLSCALAIAPALADAPDVPKLPAPSTTSMPGYAAADPGCLEWANGCWMHEGGVYESEAERRPANRCHCEVPLASAAEVDDEVLGWL